MLSWMTNCMRRVRQVLASQVCASTLETGLVVGAAVLGATVMASSLGSAGVNTSREGQAQVESGVAESSTMLQLSGAATAQIVELTAGEELNVVQNDADLPVEIGSDTRVVNAVTFQVKNDSANPYSLSGVEVTYQDKTQVVNLNDPNLDLVRADNTTLSNGVVTFKYLFGSPFGTASSEGGSPSIKNGDLVEVTVDLSGLGNKLSANSNFSISIQAQGGQPFSFEAKTPEQLSDVESL